MRILAIDPGNTHSGWVIIDSHTRRPLQIDKSPNELVLDHCYGDLQWDTAVIEMIASYGMAVGREVFDTCIWIGRFTEAIKTHTEIYKPNKTLDQALTYTVRQTVKLHHCHTIKAKDANIIQALIDRFTPGQPNRGKGTKANPGWFYGFKADIWQAYALAVQHADQLEADTARDVLPGVPAREQVVA